MTETPQSDTDRGDSVEQDVDRSFFLLIDVVVTVDGDQGDERGDGVAANGQ